MECITHIQHCVFSCKVCIFSSLFLGVQALKYSNCILQKTPTTTFSWLHCLNTHKSKNLTLLSLSGLQQIWHVSFRLWCTVWTFIYRETSDDCTVKYLVAQLAEKGVSIFIQAGYVFSACFICDFKKRKEKRLFSYFLHDSPLPI